MNFLLNILSTVMNFLFNILSVVILLGYAILSTLVLRDEYKEYKYQDTSEKALIVGWSIFVGVVYFAAIRNILRLIEGNV